MICLRVGLDLLYVKSNTNGYSCLHRDMDSLGAYVTVCLKLGFIRGRDHYE